MKNIIKLLVNDEGKYVEINTFCITNKNMKLKERLIVQLLKLHTKVILRIKLNKYLANVISNTVNLDKVINYLYVRYNKKLKDYTEKILTGIILPILIVNIITSGILLSHITDNVIIQTIWEVSYCIVFFYLLLYGFKWLVGTLRR